VVWLLSAGANAEESRRPPPERTADGGGAPRVIPVEQRLQQFSPRDSSASGANRLSREERRQLRRDVHAAGRDLYSDRMPSAHGEPRSK